MNVRSLVVGLYLTNWTVPADVSAQTALPEWTLQAAPLFEVGLAEGPEAEMFVRVFDAALLPDGGLVVLDAGAIELRFFDSDGEFVASSGRQGEGPGEFIGPYGVEVLGDSVVVWDFSRRTLSYWSTRGEFIREQRIEHHRTFHEGALWPDGSLAIPDYGADGAREPTRGRFRSQAVLLRYTGNEPQDLGQFPYEEMLAGNSISGAIPFRSASRAAAGGSPLQVYIGDDTNRPVVRWLDPRSGQAQPMALVDTRERITRGAWRSLTEAVPGTRGVESLFRDALGEWGRPDLTPAFDDLIADARGRLWVVSTALSGERLAVIYENGAPVARMGVPSTMRILAIGQDRLVAVVLGPLDIEAVQVLSFRPS